MRKWLLLAGVLVGVLIAAVGVALVFVPAALVLVGGLLAFLCDVHLRALERGGS